MRCHATCDHNDSDAGLSTHPDSGQNFLPRRVQHAHATHEGEVRLKREEPEGKSASQETLKFTSSTDDSVCGHLVGGEATGLLQVEAANVRRCVPSGHGEAAQRVPPRAPLSHRGQQLLPQRWAQWHARRAAEPDVVAALQDALRCPLLVVMRGAKRLLVSRSSEQLVG